MKGSWRTAASPPGWEHHRLVDAVTFPSGQVDPREEPFRSMTLVAPDHISSGTGRLLAKVTAAEQNAISGKYRFEPGDVIYSKIRPYLRKAIRATFAGLSSADMYPLRATSGLDSGFLLYLLLGEHFSRFAEIASTRSGFPKINRTELAEYTTTLPPLAEQRSIAEILDTLDEAIRKTEEIIAKLKQVKQGLLHDLLTRGIDENGELRDPQRHPEQFKDSPLGRIPKAWKVSSLEDLAMAPICYGIVQAGRFCPGGPLVLMIRNLSGDFATRLHRTTPQIDAGYARSRTAPGDLLLSIKGTIGRAAVVPPHFRGNISRDLARLRFSSAVLPRFALHAFSGAAGVRRLQAAVVGTTRAEISIHVLKRVRLAVPSVDEQQNVADLLDSGERHLARELKAQQKLAILKMGLMEDLLTGRVRVDP